MVVVILGILIAFQIEEYRAGLEAARQEQASLRSIVRDLDLGQEEFELYIASARDSHARFLELLELVHSEGPPTSDAIEAASRLPSDRLWRPTATAFNSIRETGRLDLISDAELQRGLVTYFDTFEPFFLDIRLSLSEERESLRRLIETDVELVPTEDCGGWLCRTCIESARQSVADRPGLRDSTSPC